MMSPFKNPVVIHSRRSDKSVRQKEDPRSESMSFYCKYCILYKDNWTGECRVLTLGEACGKLLKTRKHWYFDVYELKVSE